MIIQDSSRCSAINHIPDRPIVRSLHRSEWLLFKTHIAVILLNCSHRQRTVTNI